MKSHPTLVMLGALVAGGCSAVDQPLIFEEHVLSTPCFAASAMRVQYGAVVTEACPTLARAKTPDDDKQLRGVILGLRAFMGPLQVQWKSADGTQLSATLNLEDIFPGKRVLHREDLRQIEPTLPVFTTPRIIVEVNDRTLTIYMDVSIGLKTEEAGKVRRLSRNRLIAYQKTFN